MLLSLHAQVVLDVHHPYVRQTYRNRAIFHTYSGFFTFVVPVQHATNALYCDILLSTHPFWYRNACRTLQTLYGRAPYFTYFFEDYQAVFQKKHRRLVDLNMDLLQLIFRHVGMASACTLSQSTGQSYTEGVADCLDLRDTITPKQHKKVRRDVHAMRQDTRYTFGGSSLPFCSEEQSCDSQMPGSEVSALHTLFHIGPSAFFAGKTVDLP